jgi:tRNA (guanine37-N1)-methyltransferase
MQPPVNKGMIQLNRELFKRTFRIQGLSVNNSFTQLAMKELRNDCLLNIPRIKPVVHDPDDSINKRLILLQTHVHGLQDLSKKALDFIQKTNAEFKNYDIELDYDYWNHDDIFKSILPNDIEIPTSFETIGHIAHVNLREQHMPYKHIIGQVLLDKIDHIKTVVNKIGKIHHDFRFFDMELLAGGIHVDSFNFYRE